MHQGPPVRPTVSELLTILGRLRLLSGEQLDESARLARHWLARQPAAFWVAGTADGTVAGLAVLIRLPTAETDAAETDAAETDAAETDAEAEVETDPGVAATGHCSCNVVRASAWNDLSVERMLLLRFGRCCSHRRARSKYSLALAGASIF